MTVERPAPPRDLLLLARILRMGVGVALAAAAVGAVAPGSVGRTAAVLCLVVLIATPMLRVAWLTVDWLREGDRRFAALGALLLAVLALSGMIALI